MDKQLEINIAVEKRAKECLEKVHETLAMIKDVIGDDYVAGRDHGRCSLEIVAKLETACLHGATCMDRLQDIVQRRYN